MQNMHLLRDDKVGQQTSVEAVAVKLASREKNNPNPNPTTAEYDM